MGNMVNQETNTDLICNGIYCWFMIAKLFYNLVDGLIRGMARLSTIQKVNLNQQLEPWHLVGGLSHIFMENKIHVPNHQPWHRSAFKLQFGGWFPVITSSWPSAICQDTSIPWAVRIPGHRASARNAPRTSTGDHSCLEVRIFHWKNEQSTSVPTSLWRFFRTFFVFFHVFPKLVIFGRRLQLLPLDQGCPQHSRYFWGSNW